MAFVPVRVTLVMFAIGTACTGSPATPAGVGFETDSVTLDRWGDVLTARAHVFDDSGATITGVDITYESSDPAVVVVQLGTLISGHEGTAQVTARAAGFTATLDVTVAIQRNPQCQVPGAPVSPGPVAAPISYVATQGRAGPALPFVSMVIPFDANADGNLDLVIAAQDQDVRATYSSITVFVGDGNGGFTDGTASVYPGTSPFNGPREYGTADINGDGLEDIVIANAGFDPQDIGCGQDGICLGAPNAILLAQAGGGLQNGSSALQPNYDHQFTHSMGLGDLDCDGDPDLFEGAWRNPSAPDVPDVKLNEGGVLTTVPGRTTLANASGAAVCDLDRDGDLDLVASEPSADLLVFVNNGFGYFRALPAEVLPAPRQPATIGSDISCADLDGDGALDIVYHDHTFGENYGKWTVIHNDGGMRFSGWNQVLPDPEARYVIPRGGSSTRFHDLNGDGWMDMLSGNDGQPLRILWNTGGAFIEQVVLDENGNQVPGAAPAAGDFNGDQLLDLILVRGTGSTSTVLLSQPQQP